MLLLEEMEEEEERRREETERGAGGAAGRVRDRRAKAELDRRAFIVDDTIVGKSARLSLFLFGSEFRSAAFASRRVEQPRVRYSAERMSVERVRRCDARHGWTRPTLFPATRSGGRPGQHGNTRSRARRQMEWGNYRAAVV